MIYLDYSATTPVNEDVLNSFVKVNREYIGNTNSIHKLGLKSRELLEEAVKQVANSFNVLKEEVIFTSGASESNSMALLGIVNKYKNRGKHIITTKLEHSSVSETVLYLEKNGFIIDYVNLLDNGLIDIADLENKITNETILVSISYVNSEIGIKQDIEKIGEILKKYSMTFFHVDATQAVGKIPVKLDSIDLFSCSAHKFYGLKGIGLLIKKKKIDLEPLIHGGKSQTIYRSGTPALPLIVSFAKALRIALENLDNNYNHVLTLNKYLVLKLKNNKKIIINSNDECIPHILNISILGIKPETMIHALEIDDIYVSTKTACSMTDGVSTSLLEFTKNLDISKSSIRISLSHLTTIDELDIFINKLNEKIDKLTLK